eukprot:Pgem_evm1s18810
MLFDKNLGIIDSETNILLLLKKTFTTVSYPEQSTSIKLAFDNVARGLKNVLEGDDGGYAFFLPVIGLSIIQSVNILMKQVLVQNTFLSSGASTGNFTLSTNATGNGSNVVNSNLDPISSVNDTYSDQSIDNDSKKPDSRSLSDCRKYLCILQQALTNLRIIVERSEQIRVFILSQKIEPPTEMTKVNLNNSVLTGLENMINEEKPILLILYQVKALGRFLLKRVDDNEVIVALLFVQTKVFQIMETLAQQRQIDCFRSTFTKEKQTIFNLNVNVDNIDNYCCHYLFSILSDVLLLQNLGSKPIATIRSQVSGQGSEMNHRHRHTLHQQQYQKNRDKLSVDYNAILLKQRVIGFMTAMSTSLKFLHGFHLRHKGVFTPSSSTSSFSSSNENERDHPCPFHLVIDLLFTKLRSDVEFNTNISNLHLTTIRFISIVMLKSKSIRRDQFDKVKDDDSSQSMFCSFLNVMPRKCSCGPNLISGLIYSLRDYVNHIFNVNHNSDLNDNNLFVSHAMQFIRESLFLWHSLSYNNTSMGNSERGFNIQLCMKKKRHVCLALFRRLIILLTELPAHCIKHMSKSTSDETKESINLVQEMIDLIEDSEYDHDNKNNSFGNNNNDNSNDNNQGNGHDFDLGSIENNKTN